MNRKPTYTERKPLALREVPPPPSLMGMIVPNVNSYLRCYDLGECTVIVTRDHGRWHLSIAHPKRYPVWDEIAEARYRCIPDPHVTMALPLPELRRYVNINKNCFQIKEVPSGTFAED